MNVLPIKIHIICSVPISAFSVDASISEERLERGVCGVLPVSVLFRSFSTPSALTGSLEGGTKG